MENSDSNEPEKKRPHLDSSSLSPSTASTNNNNTIDFAVLHRKNLVRQLETQKQELHDLESKIKGLKDTQTAYDDVLIQVNRQWNQLVDDLVLLGVRVGRGPDTLEILDHADYTGGNGLIPSCPAGEMFLCRLLGTDSIQSDGNEVIIEHVEKALASRCSSTMELMQILEDTINCQREKTESIAQALHGNPATDAITIFSKIDDLMKEEVKNLHEVIEVLQSKHKEYADAVKAYVDSNSEDQSEIKHLAGEIEEKMAELEESRRKLVNLKMQKDAAAGLHSPSLGQVNGHLSPKMSMDKSKGFRELRESIEETKILASDRQSELQEAKDENQILLKELEELQNEQSDDKYVHSSRLFNLVNDQLQHWNAEVQRYKALTDSLQADRSFLVRREKELNAKSESADAAKNYYETSETRIEELEQQLLRCINENNELDMKMEEAVQDSGREDIKAEFRVMASALSREMGMLEAQLNRWKQTAHEACSLREESQSLKASLSQKADEEQCSVGECAEQMLQIKNLEEEIEKLQKENLESQLVLDMYGQEGYENRDLHEIKESERRAHLQVEALKNALDENSLELRVKAAYEAEAANQRRLSAAEAEIAELTTQLEASDREFLEIKEAIKIKDVEAEEYITEIETIGQAYEDMQTQNQCLLQQLTERDDYNIKLVSDSVKMKQEQSHLQFETQALAKQLQEMKTSVQSVTKRIAQSEEQMKAFMIEAMGYIEEDRHLTISLETTRGELTDLEKELKWLKYANAASEKENEQIEKMIDEYQTELDGERGDRKKLEEELMELNREFSELSSESVEARIQRLQDEIKDCKSILKCSVCSDRPKEVVIVKCFHLFCNPCIQRNLEIRHRKCPGCGTPFGQNDVRFVKI